MRCRIIIAAIPVTALAAWVFGFTWAAVASMEKKERVEVVCIDDAMETGGRFIYLPENSLKERGE